MLRFFGRLIIKILSGLLSLALGIVQLIFSIALELATKVLSYVLFPIAFFIVFCLIQKNIPAAEVLGIMLGAAYLVIFIIAGIMMHIGYIREGLLDIYFGKLFRRWCLPLLYRWVTAGLPLSYRSITARLPLNYRSRTFSNCFSCDNLYNGQSKTPRETRKALSFSFAREYGNERLTKVRRFLLPYTTRSRDDDPAS